MWRGRVHGAWFWGAVAIAVIGIVAIGSRSTDAVSWVIAVVTFLGVAYCLFRASQRSSESPPER